MAEEATSPSMKVGLTGGIASGKSLAAAAFQALGVTVVDADDLSREVVVPGSEGLVALTREIGAGFLNARGELDRSKLRDAIFREPSLRQRVEAVLHPRILALLGRRLNTADGPYVVGVVPLLDAELKRSLFQRVVVVDCPAGEQVRRLMERDGETRESARRILDSQPSREERIELADDVLSNDGTTRDLKERVATLHEKLVSIARRETGY